jgi:predicted nuclease with TOPRIM domain
MDEKDIEHRLTEVEGRSKSNTHRLDDLERRQGNLDDLVSTVKVLAVREEAVENDVKEIKNDVKSLTSKPGQRWDSLVDKIIWAVAAALIAFVLARIGL